MEIYFSFYVVVIALAMIWESVTKKNKKIGAIWLLIVASVMSAFAGARATSVGVDIEVYGISSFRNCFHSSNLNEYLGIYSSDYMYYVINWVVSRVTGNFNVLLYVMQFIGSLCICKLAYVYREKASITLVIATYLLFFYNTSLNVLRQSLAIMIMLYSYRYIGQKKYYINALIAYFCHASAIICIIIPALSKSVRSKKGSIILIAFIGALSIGLMNIETLIKNIPFISNKYLMYIGDGNLNFKYLMLKIIMFIVIGVFSKFCRKDRDIATLTLIMLCDLVFYAASYKIMYIYRLSYFFSVHIVLLIPMISRKITKYENKVLFNAVMIAMLVAHWIIRYKVIGYDGVLPYVSVI